MVLLQTVFAGAAATVGEGAAAAASRTGAAGQLAAGRSVLFGVGHALWRAWWLRAQLARSREQKPKAVWVAAKRGEISRALRGMVASMQITSTGEQQPTDVSTAPESRACEGCTAFGIFDVCGRPVLEQQCRRLRITLDRGVMQRRLVEACTSRGEGGGQCGISDARYAIA